MPLQRPHSNRVPRYILDSQHLTSKILPVGIGDKSIRIKPQYVRGHSPDSAIETVYRSFGGVKNVRLLPQKLGLAYLCLVEFDPPKPDASKIEELGAIDDGDKFAFRIPLTRSER
jgi:hypothetical protein